MFDVKRIRERAADWLGDVGGAALVAAGEVVSILGQRLRGDETRWLDNIARGGFGHPDSDELRARATSAGTSPPAGQDPAPHPPGGGQPVDEACATCGGSGEVNYEDYTGQHDCPTCEKPAVKPTHNAEAGALGEAREVGVCSRPSGPGCALAQPMGRPCSCGAPLILAGVVTPPDPFVIIMPEALAAGPSKVGGAYAEAMGAPRGCLCTWEARRDRGVARGVERRGPGAAPCPVHPEESSGIDAMIGDRIVNVRPSMHANLCAIAAEATRATDANDGAPHHVASMLTAGEARRHGPTATLQVQVLVAGR